ncbi:MAG: response regulator transcription factor [Pseudomonadota bacterium]
MNNGPRITLVDDDRNILTSVAMALEAEGFRVKAFGEGALALPDILKNTPDLVILDVKMPRMDGIELLQKLRESSSVPVIFLTSKDDEIDEIVGLRMGADDYVTKPFSQRLLVERIRSLLRRHLAQTAKPAAAPVTGPKSIEVSGLKRGRLEMDDDRHLCRWNGRAINLTVTEYLLVKSLIARPGHVRSRDQLISAAYGPSTYVDDRIIDSHVKRIRKKFKEAEPDFSQIETLYGVGYRFNEE